MIGPSWAQARCTYDKALGPLSEASVLQLRVAQLCKPVLRRETIIENWS